MHDWSNGNTVNNRSPASLGSTNDLDDDGDDTAADDDDVISYLAPVPQKRPALLRSQPEAIIKAVRSAQHVRTLDPKVGRTTCNSTNLPSEASMVGHARASLGCNPSCKKLFPHRGTQLGVPSQARLRTICTGAPHSHRQDVHGADNGDNREEYYLCDYSLVLGDHPKTENHATRS